MNPLQIKASGDIETLDVYPTSCPFCHNSITADFVTAIKIYNHKIEAVFRCPAGKCRKLFIGYYDRYVSESAKMQGKGFYQLKSVSIGTGLGREFDVEVKTLSPLFVEIYNQSLAAEGYSLNHIAGMGYRKALEFVIKDYLIRKEPTKAEEIRKKFLGECIKQHVDNEKIKSMSAKAAWLGNDETHYERKWVDKDINDLKALLEITIHWIHMEILTEKYDSEMK